jgi:hypothetical protein
MPTRREKDAARSRLVDEAARQLARGISAAEVLVSYPDQQGNAITGSSAKSAAPWNDGAADALLTAHEGARRLEASLRAQVTGKPGTRRGSSPAHTAAALIAIVRLAEAVHSDDAARAARILARWARSIELLPGLDEAVRWIPIRLDPDAPRPPLCRYCRRYTLRRAEGRYIVACLNPACPGDENGVQPVGRLELTELHGAAIVWSDGTIQSARYHAAHDEDPPA